MITHSPVVPAIGRLRVVPPSGRATVDLAADAADGVDGVHVEVDEGDDEAADVPRSCLHGCWAKLPLFE